MIRPCRFAFGDSWSANGYEADRGYNLSLQPLRTSTGGQTWLNCLCSSPSTPQLRTSHYSLAVAGATVLHSAKAPMLPNISLSDQVDLFETWFVTSSRASRPRWSASTTLFSIFLGSNDVAFRWWTGDSTAPHIQTTFAVFGAQIERLYGLGARHFLLFSVPPYERAPVVVAVNRLAGDVRVKLGASIAAWNAVLRLYVREIPRRYSGASAELVDVWSWFDGLLDRADEYGFVNPKSWCPSYARGSGVAGVPEQLSLEKCNGSLAQHLWYDGIHPTWSVHRLLAASVREQLSRRTAGLSLGLPSLADVDKHFPLEQLSYEERSEAESEYRRTVLSGEEGRSTTASGRDDELPTLFPVLA
ncbi:hypothetical protein JCM8208_001629 [Rhodotorula glutinis]